MTNQHIVRPGLGWKRLAGSVWEHSSGARVHCAGLVKMPSGVYYSIRNWAESKGMRKTIAINGGNVKRGLMAWCVSQIKLEQKQ